MGGRIDVGVGLLDNLKREVREETGLAVKDEPVLIAAQDIFKDGRHVVRLTYLGNVEYGKVHLDKTENDMYQWLTLVEIEKQKDLDVYSKKVLEDVILIERIKSYEIQ